LAYLYGRPLFGLLDDDPMKELNAYLMRLCVGDLTVISSAFHMSLLGTRFQLGHTTFYTASELISKSYTHLIHL